MALSNAPSASNVNENWLFQFSADNDTCLEFDGTDDYVSFGNVLTRYLSFTLEAWIKPDAYSASSGTQIILERSEDGSTAAKNTNWQIALSNNGLRCKYQYGTGSNVVNVVTTSAITVNNWHHVAVLRDDSNDEMRFYVDGVKIGTVTTDVSNPPSAGTSGVVSIGSNFEQNNEFDGEIAHTRVWSMARSDNQIAHYYNRTIDSTASNLVGYWKLDEGTGSTVLDSSSNSNSGTITDANWSVGGFDEFIHSFGIANSDATVDNNFYTGAVLNKNVSVRDSIDITAGQSTTSNISLNVANVVFDGIDLYKRIFNGTNNYLNKEVRVYAQFNGSNSLADCQRIFTGRLVDVKIDQNQKLSLQINSHRPWDKISFPQTKHSIKGIYEPTVYGEYDFVDLTTTPIQAVYGNVFPVPILNVSQGSATSGSTTHDGTFDVLMPQSYSSGDKNYIHLHLDDYFLVVTQQPGVYTVQEATVSESNVNVLKTPISYFAHGLIIPSVGENQWGVSMISNMENAFIRNKDGDYDLTTFASADINSVGDIAYIQSKSFTKNFTDSQIHGIRVQIKAERDDADTSVAGYQAYDVDIFKNGSTLSSNSVYDEDAAIIQTSGNGNEDVYDITNTDAPTEFQMKFTSLGTSGAGNNPFSAHTLKIYGVKLRAVIDIHDSDQEDVTRLSNMKYLYSGGAGLPASWDNGAIKHGHDAHRDLLMRFGGIPSTTPVNYDSLNTDRTRNTANDADIDDWKIRYWQLEPASLKDKLDQLAYEFGFCYKMDSNGVLKYIHVKQSSELSATLNLTQSDLNNINVSTTGLSEVITKMELSNRLHPAESSRYYQSVTATNIVSRAKYNLGDKEGIKQQNLDMHVGDLPTSAASDCNADWYSYYNNIIGDIKVLVQCDVVNPAKGCQLETGDIVTFTDMPVEMFGTDFSTSTYFMIVETKRSPGKVSITAREVG